MRVSLIIVYASDTYQVSMVDTLIDLNMRPLGSRSISAHCAVRSESRKTTNIPSQQSSGGFGTVGHAISQARYLDFVVETWE